MTAPQIEVQKQIDDDLKGLGDSLDVLKKSLEKKEIAEDNSNSVSLIKEMMNNIVTLDDSKDTKIKDLLATIDKDKKVTPEMIDVLVTKIIDIKLKVLQDTTDKYTNETASKHLQIEKLTSQKNSLNILLQSINKTPTTTPTTKPEDTQRFAKNRKRVLGGVAGLAAFIGLTRSNKDEKGESKWILSRIWRGIKYGAIAGASALGLWFLLGTARVDKALQRFGLEKEAAPNVTADDANDTITGLTKDMEYSTDAGKTYIKYDGVTTPKFAGDQKVLVRTAKSDKNKESKPKELLFTSAVSANTPSNAPTTAPEQNNLTTEELAKRNKYITDSINATTTFPIVINYGTDKTALEAKWCPSKIDFDASSQSIKFGNDQLKASVGSFTTQSSYGEATVDSISINTISYAWDKFKLNVTGTWTVDIPLLGAQSKTDTQEVDVSKAQLLQMLTPYYQDNKGKYSVSLADSKWNAVPVTIEKIGWTTNTPNNAPSNVPQTAYEKEFATLEQRKQSQYTDLSNNVIATYGGIVSFAGTNNLPPLIKNYDPSVNQLPQNPWSIAYMMDKSFDKVGDIISDGFFNKVANTANLGVDYVAEFLTKYKDTKYVGGVLDTVGWWLKGLITTPTSETDIKTKLANDPEGMKRISVLIKQIAIFRFFITEKRKVLKDQYIKSGMKDPELSATLDAKIDNLKITGATETDPSFYQTLKENNLINTTISAEITAGLVINKSATLIQKKIEETAKKTNFQWERGNLTFDYTTSTLTSRWKSTKLEIAADGKVKIKDLDINFATIEEAVRFANATNRFTNRYFSVREKAKGTVGVGGNILYRSGSGFRHGIFEDVSRAIDTRVLSASALENNYSGWTDALGEKYVAYVNKQIKSFSVQWVVDKVTSIIN